MSRRQVYEWTENFKKGVTSVEDSRRPGPAVTEDNIAAVENVKLEIRRVTVKEVASLPDFHVFGPLKDALSGTQFRDDDEVRSAVHEWLRTLPKGFFSRGIYALVKRWHKCIELEGDYVEQQ